MMSTLLGSGVKSNIDTTVPHTHCKLIYLYRQLCM